MDQYTDLVINKVPELGFVNLLSHIYQTVGLCHGIDISKFKSNCNGYVVERFDQSSTAGKVSCIPLSILMELVDRGILRKPDKSKQEIEIKTDLATELINNTNGFEDIVTIPTSIPIKYFFKPALKEKISTAIDFSRMDIKADDVSKLGVNYGANNKITKIEIKPERDAWMTNTSIQQLIIPMAFNTSIAYIGQFNFNFLNGLPIYEKYSVFKQSRECFLLKRHIKNNKVRFIMLGFCYRYHWKCLIFDNEKKFLSFYDSGGNNPEHFTHYLNFFYFSNSLGFNRNTSSAGLEDENVDIDILFQFFMDNYNARYGCINIEVNQLLESECGMFTSIFMILCCINPPDWFKGIRKIYTFFRFLADKKMTMLKSILFNNNTMRCETTYTKSSGMEEYLRMEEWSKKTINILANKISYRIDTLVT